MKKLTLAIILCLVVFTLQAAPESIKIKYTNESGKTETINGTLIEVDYDGWRLHIETAPNQRIWIHFTKIESSLYKLLQEHADSPEKLYASAKYMLFINKLDLADNLIEKAVKAGFDNEKQIEEFYAQLREFEGQKLIREIQENIVNGNFDDARKDLEDLKDKKYSQTQSYSMIDKLESQINRAELNSNGNPDQMYRDYEKKFAEGIAVYELELATGHEEYFSAPGTQSCKKTWDRIIKELDPGNSNSLLTLIRAYEKQQPEGILRARIKVLREKATEVLICAYKNVISYQLSRDSFAEIYDYLIDALKISPLDRELLYYWYIYDEYRPLITTPLKGDDDDDEEERK